jgi:curved DNA-binding protein CbpA
MNREDDSAKEFVDYYKLLAVDVTATDADIRKSWRRKAVELHPDKHGDEVDRYRVLFDAAKRAYEVLSNHGKRAEYNKELSQHFARVQAEKDRIERYKHEDSRLRQMRIELERREAESTSEQRHKRQREDDDIVRTQNKEFIERIKQQRQNQQRHHHAAKRTLHQQYTSRPSYADSMNGKHHDTDRAEDKSRAGSISIKWPKQNSSLSSLYSEQYLRTAFGVYGHIVHIVMNSKRCRAIIVYERESAAMKAVDMMKIDNRLKVKFIDESDANNLHNDYQDDDDDKHSQHSNGVNLDEKANESISKATENGDSSTAPSSYDDYEAETLRRMQEAATAAKRKAKQPQPQQQQQQPQQEVHDHDLQRDRHQEVT